MSARSIVALSVEAFARSVARGRSFLASRPPRGALGAWSALAALAACTAESPTNGPRRPPTTNETPEAPTDARPSDAGSDGTASGPTPPAGKEIFVAVGHMGRSIVSCDDGQTWIHDRSDDDDARCWVDGDPNYVECDHTPSSSPSGGIAYGDGWFYASYGWGYDGSLRRSRDGFRWETVKSDGWGGGVAFAKQSVFVLWEGDWSRSTDHGVTWEPVTPTPEGFDHPFPRAVGDRLFAIGRPAGTAKGALSDDGGKTWSPVTGLAQDTARHIVEGKGVLVGIGDGGVAARSVDGGKTWTSTPVVTGGEWTTNLLFDGSAFVAWAGNVRWTSTDGATWSPSAPSPSLPGGWTAAVGFSPTTKTYVAILSAWRSYYAAQKAYRSTDGLTWATLDASHFHGGHPLWNVVAGRVDPEACAAPDGGASK